MRGGAALKLLRLRHHLNFSLSWYLNVSLASSSKHTLFVFWNTLWILIRMSKRKQPNLSQFGFTKQTKRSDDSAPATTSLPVLPPPPLKVAARLVTAPAPKIARLGRQKPLLCELFCFYHDLHDVGLSAVDSEPWTELFALTLTTLTDACVLK
jgi:hypothetical protein